MLVLEVFFVSNGEPIIPWRRNGEQMVSNSTVSEGPFLSTPES